MYDIPSIVLGICICISFGLLVAIINLLVEKALYYRSERKYLDKMEVLEDE